MRYQGVCPYCKKSFVSYHTQKYCSRKCRGEDDLGRFYSKYIAGSPDECWDWNGGINSTGRGIFLFRGKSIHAHRVAWIIANGDIPNGLNVCHHCDNGKCVNPNHLFLGTPRDNMHDMISKGRKVILRGSDDPKSKLTEEEVIQIRALYTPRGEYSQFKLAKTYGVSRTAIEGILHRRTWKHI